MRKRYRVIGWIGVIVVAGLSGVALLISHDSPCTQSGAIMTPGGMRAGLSRCYGSPDVIRLEQTSKPEPAAGRMVVRVRAASLNPVDWHYLRGAPYFMRLDSGLGTPNDPRLGIDFSGTVESVGAGVTTFKAGDQVFGSAAGAFAQFVSVRAAGAVTLKPANLTFEQAAAVPVAAVTALQALREHGHVRAGQHVLINGASGGVGTFAVQLAKLFGAEVTGVCSAKNARLVLSLGADRVIDYAREDFTRAAQRYDLIIDNVGNHTVREYRGVLKPNGTLVLVGSQDPNPWMWATAWRALAALADSPFRTQHVQFMLAEQTDDNLGELGEWLGAGKITPVIDRHYPLDDLADALRYLEQGHARGKIVLDIADGSAT